MPPCAIVAMHLRSLSVGDAGDAEVPVRQPLLPDFGKLQSALYLDRLAGFALGLSPPAGLVKSALPGRRLRPLVDRILNATAQALRRSPLTDGYQGLG